jgi:hypothetical protein
MDFITPTIKPSIDALKSILAAARRKCGKRRYKQLLAVTFSELLKEHPDLDTVQANLAAAAAAGATPDADLLRAKSMYRSAHRYHHGIRAKKTAKARRAAWQAKKTSRTRKRVTAVKRKGLTSHLSDRR